MGDSNQKEAKTYQEWICAPFPHGWDTGGFYLACFGAPGIILAILSVISGERGEEMGGGHERESSGARDGRIG